MNKILITILVPSIDEQYDLFVPINMKITEAIDLIQSAIYELSGEYYHKNPSALLIDNIDGKIINPNNIVKYSGLRNGSRIMLV